jgi:glycosyltransferase involved in cell wall biosynthesis
MTTEPRVSVPRHVWPEDRFPDWAVAALQAAGARVTEDARTRSRGADVALVPAAGSQAAASVHARRIVGLLDAPPRPGDPRLRGTEVVATSAALAAAWDGPARVVRPAVPPGSRAADNGRALRIVSVGPLHWSAGHEHAVVAVASLIAGGATVELRVAGDGPGRAEVLFAAFDLGIKPAVTLVAGEREAVQSADVVVVPAVEDRAWTGLLHAFACGVPAVATDLPTARELAATVLVPPRDPGALAAALGALADDPPRRADLAARGRRAALTDVAACGRALLGVAR